MASQSIFSLSKPPSVPPRVAFFDIDGTILKKDMTISPAVIEKIKKLKKSGVHVCLATGRPYFGASMMIEKLEISSPSMFFSGALVINPLDNEVLSTTCLEQAELIRLYEKAKEHSIYFEAYNTSDYFVSSTNHLTDIHNEYLKHPPIVTDIPSILKKESVLKLVLMSDTPEQLSRMQTLMREFPTLNYGISYGASHPHVTFANITSSKSSRDSIFDLFLKHFSVDAEETIAFGDALADIPFLKRAGYGIAVGNADEEAKKAAKYTTLSVEEDGVALALEKLGF